MLSTQAATSLLGVERRARTVGLGSPISPVEPPTSASGRWPACCRRRSGEQLDQVPVVQARRGRVEAAVVGDRARVEGLAQGSQVGALRDQAAPLQVVEESSASVTVGRPSLMHGRVGSTRTSRARAARRAATRYRGSVRRHGRLAVEPEPPRARRAVAGDTRPAARAAPSPRRPRPAPASDRQRRPRVGRVRAVVRRRRRRAPTVSRAGPRARSRGYAVPSYAAPARARRPRRPLRPAAAPPRRSPAGPQTRFMHQCMP